MLVGLVAIDRGGKLTVSTAFHVNSNRLGEARKRRAYHLGSQALLWPVSSNVPPQWQGPPSLYPSGSCLSVPHLSQVQMTLTSQRADSCSSISRLSRYISNPNQLEARTGQEQETAPKNRSHSQPHGPNLQLRQPAPAVKVARFPSWGCRYSIGTNANNFNWGYPQRNIKIPLQLPTLQEGSKNTTNQLNHRQEPGHPDNNTSS